MMTEPYTMCRLSNSLSEVSLNDWALREQEGLREVEEILDRAAEILQVSFFPYQYFFHYA